MIRNPTFPPLGSSEFGRGIWFIEFRIQELIRNPAFPPLGSLEIGSWASFGEEARNRREDADSMIRSRHSRLVCHRSLERFTVAVGGVDAATPHHPGLSLSFDPAEVVRLRRLSGSQGVAPSRAPRERKLLSSRVSKRRGAVIGPSAWRCPGRSGSSSWALARGNHARQR
jgi:hypothetical protein